MGAACATPSGSAGIDAPQNSSAAMPTCRRCRAASATPTGKVIAPDPATLPPDELDFHHAVAASGAAASPRPAGGRWNSALPSMCRWSASRATMAIEGGQGELYSSAILMRGGRRAIGCRPTTAPVDPARSHARQALRLQQPRFHVGHHRADARPGGDGRKPRHLFRAHRERRAPRLDRRGCRGQGGCRAIDCRSWALAQRFEPAAKGCRSSAGRHGARACRMITAEHTPEEISGKAVAQSLSPA